MPSQYTAADHARYRALLKRYTHTAEPRTNNSTSIAQAFKDYLRTGQVGAGLSLEGDKPFIRLSEAPEDLIQWCVDTRCTDVCYEVPPELLDKLILPRMGQRA